MCWAASFAPAFTRQLDVSPGRYVEQCRLERARQYLEETDEPLSEIAACCGYATPDGLRLAFARNLGVAPRAYRRSFSSASARARGAGSDLSGDFSLWQQTIHRSRDLTVRLRVVRSSGAAPRRGGPGFSSVSSEGGATWI